MEEKAASTLVRVFLLVTFFAGFTAMCNAQTAAPNAQNVENKSDLCESEIYCTGELLKTVQLARLYTDSKVFVDYIQLNDPSVTLNKQLMNDTNDNPSTEEIRQFVTENFKEYGGLVEWIPPDWQANPPILQKVQDTKYRKWLKTLNQVWNELARKLSNDSIEHPERYSLITVNNGFIIPGGRFREFYYWDSYWVIEGLLLCGMNATVKGILENFLSMVENYGFIPNGGRVYYLMRSQPPLLIPMVDLYVKMTNDLQFLTDNLLTLAKEFDYFQRTKTVNVEKNGKTYKMARYVVNSEGPRPESYREDYELAVNMSEERKKAFYSDIKAGAESGWDFSARWFIVPSGENGSLSHIATSSIIPVDLNAFLQRNARLLAEYVVANVTKAQYYLNISKDYQDAIDNVLWNEDVGTWLDYDLKNKQQRNIFYPSNLTPLYTKSFDATKAATYAQKAVHYLKAKGIDNYPGGIPASLDKTGQQWDFPNAWPPLQSIVVRGLYNTNSQPALDFAKKLATTWLTANYIGFRNTSQMYEKYDAEHAGKYGGGGEYEVQDGFGWTNGVIFEFLNMYPESTAPDQVCSLFKKRVDAAKIKYSAKVLN